MGYISGRVSLFSATHSQLERRYSKRAVCANMARREAIKRAGFLVEDFFFFFAQSKSAAKSTRAFFTHPPYYAPINSHYTFYFFSYTYIILNYFIFFFD